MRIDPDCVEADAAPAAAIRAAAEGGTTLRLRGAGSKAFFADVEAGDRTLELGDYRGIIDYAPDELVLVARAGTPLVEIETALDDAGQMLAFEPPQYGGGGTIGGCVAAGWSGPRRPYAGSVRDHVLGVRLIDGRGRALRFGGTVIKNVAGFDVPRLMTGARGTLGVLRDIALKVLPQPRHERTLCYACTELEAIEQMNRVAGREPLLSASAYRDGVLTLRLSGSEVAVTRAAQVLGGETLDEAAPYWRALRDHAHDYYSQPGPLWRVIVPPTAPPLALGLPQLIEWGGAQRWLIGTLDIAALRARVAALGGHVTAFRDAPAGISPFAPLPAPLAALQQRVRDVFDPHRVFNSGSESATFS